MEKRTLKVFPNPYSALDVDGRAAGAVMMEGLADQYIGARLDLEESNKEKRLIFKFDLSPVTVTYSAYYVRRLQARELLPADEETAKLAGLDEEYEAPESSLQTLRRERAAEFETTNGRPPMFASDQPVKP